MNFLLRTIVLLVVFISLGITMVSYTFGVPWGPMYPPVEKFKDGLFTGAVVHFKRFDESLMKNILETARRYGIKLIISIGPSNPCSFFISEVGMDEKNTCDFRRKHVLIHIDVERIISLLKPFMEHGEIFDEYITDGTIVGIRIFDEPHDIDCSKFGGPRFATVLPDDMNRIYQHLSLIFPKVVVGSTSPPCYMKRMKNGRLSFAQYRWDHRVPVDRFFREQIIEARENDLFFIGALNSNSSAVGNDVFFKAIPLLCELGVDFVTLWKWKTDPRYPHPGVEDRIENISPEILREIKRRCGQIKTF